MAIHLVSAIVARPGHVVGCSAGDQARTQRRRTEEGSSRRNTSSADRRRPVQLRNAVGFQLADGKMTLAALVDASGYSTAIQQKYQGMLITESKLNIGGSNSPPANTDSASPPTESLW